MSQTLPSNVTENSQEEIDVQQLLTEQYQATLDGTSVAEAAGNYGQIPLYTTGARAFIKLGGRPLGVCRNVTWSAAYNATPINTIDSNTPWDVAVGQLRVSVNLERVINPVNPAEAEGLFHIMKAAPHQPYIKLQILDKLGTTLFFAKGMFTEISGRVSVGDISTYSAKFIGTTYQGHIQQNYSPYGNSGTTAKKTNLLDGLKNIKSGN